MVPRLLQVAKLFQWCFCTCRHYHSREDTIFSWEIQFLPGALRHAPRPNHRTLKSNSIWKPCRCFCLPIIRFSCRYYLYSVRDFIKYSASNKLCHFTSWICYKTLNNSFACWLWYSSNSNFSGGRKGFPSITSLQTLLSNEWSADTHLFYGLVL
jgi:hypothetical protein